MKNLVGYRSRLRSINAKKGNLNNSEIARKTGLARATIIRYMGDGIIEKPELPIIDRLAQLYNLDNPYELLEAVYEGEISSEAVAV